MTREEKFEAIYKRLERLHQIDKNYFYDNYRVAPNFSYMWLMQGQVSFVTFSATERPPLHHVRSNF